MAGGILDYFYESPGDRKRREAQVADSLRKYQTEQDINVRTQQQLADQQNANNKELRQAKLDSWQDARTRELQNSRIDPHSAITQAIKERTSMETQPDLAATTGSEVTAEQNLGKLPGARGLALSQTGADKSTADLTTATNDGRLADNGAFNVGYSGAKADTSANYLNSAINAAQLLSKPDAITATNKATTADAANNYSAALAVASQIPTQSTAEQAAKINEAKAASANARNDINLAPSAFSAKAAKLGETENTSNLVAKDPAKYSHDIYHAPPFSEAQWLGQMLQQRGGLGAVPGSTGNPSAVGGLLPPKTTAEPVNPNGISPATKRRVLGFDKQ